MSRILMSVALATLILFGGCSGDATPSSSSPEASPDPSPTSSPADPASTFGANSDDADDPIAPVTGTTERPPSDRALIRDLWSGWSEAWEDGPSGGAAYLRDHDYPPYQKDADLCRQLDEDRGVKRKVYSYDDDTVRRDDGWTIPQGTQKGRKPPGRIYSMSVREVLMSDGGDRSTTGTSHVTIDGGKAYVFYDCRYFYERDQASR